MILASSHRPSVEAARTKSREPSQPLRAPRRDPGSGGITGHPAGIIFLAVSPDFKQGRVFRAWRGDGVPTTSQDTLNKYRELRRDLKPVLQVYDYASKDFFLV